MVVGIMTRARIPSPAALVDALSKMGVEIANMTGIYADRRIYDRSTGNFKAMGWLCEATTFSMAEGRYGTVYIGIPDAAIIERDQSGLTDFE